MHLSKDINYNSPMDLGVIVAPSPKSHNTNITVPISPNHLNVIYTLIIHFTHSPYACLTPLITIPVTILLDSLVLIALNSELYTKHEPNFFVCGCIFNNSVNRTTKRYIIVQYTCSELWPNVYCVFMIALVGIE